MGHYQVWTHLASFMGNVMNVWLIKGGGRLSVDWLPLAPSFDYLFCLPCSCCHAGLNDKHPVTDRTVLLEAVMMNSLAAVRVLLAAGADPCCGHAMQGPPLISAAAFGEDDITDQLLLAGADISAVDSAGDTALHYACKGGHVTTARRLLAAGASLMARNNDGELPLTFAPSDVQEQLLNDLSPEHVAAATSASEAAAVISTSTAGRVPMIPPSPPRSLQRLQSASSNFGPGSPGKPPRSPAGRVLAAAGERSRPPSGLSTGGGGGGAGHLDSSRSRLASALQIQSSGSPPSSTEASPLPSSSGRGLTRSPLSDQEYHHKAVPSSPVHLQLPVGVQLQLKGGAGSSDIASFFEQEDSAQVLMQQPTTALIFGIEPTADEVRARSEGGVGSSGGGSQRRPPSPHLAQLAAAVPLTPKFRFGIDIYDVVHNPPMGSPSSTADNPAPNAAGMRPPPTSQQQSAPKRSDDIGGGGSELGTNPFDRILSNGSAIGSAITAAAGLAASLHPFDTSQDSLLHDSSDLVGGSGEPEQALTPPLLRVASPKRSPRVMEGDDDDDIGSDGRSTGGWRGSRRGFVRSGGGGGDDDGHKPPDALRISQAAQALACRLIGATTSTEALQAHATAMFKRSAEVLTGSIMWTRGELLGEGAYGKVMMSAACMMEQAIAGVSLGSLNPSHLLACNSVAHKSLHLCGMGLTAFFNALMPGWLACRCTQG